MEGTSDGGVSICGACNGDGKHGVREGGGEVDCLSCLGTGHALPDFARMVATEWSDLRVQNAALQKKLLEVATTAGAEIRTRDEMVADLERQLSDLHKLRVGDDIEHKHAMASYRAEVESVRMMVGAGETGKLLRCERDMMVRNLHVRCCLPRGHEDGPYLSLPREHEPDAREIALAEARARQQHQALDQIVQTHAATVESLREQLRIAQANNSADATEVLDIKLRQYGHLRFVADAVEMAIERFAFENLDRKYPATAGALEHSSGMLEEILDGAPEASKGFQLNESEDDETDDYSSEEDD